jgi:hypothetical protein
VLRGININGDGRPICLINLMSCKLHSLIRTWNQNVIEMIVQFMPHTLTEDAKDVSSLSNLLNYNNLVGGIKTKLT